MKRLILSSCLLVSAMSVNARQKDFPILTGPYLGQKPPGIAPDGSYIIFDIDLIRPSEMALFPFVQGDVVIPVTMARFLRPFSRHGGHVSSAAGGTLSLGSPILDLLFRNRRPKQAQARSHRGHPDLGNLYLL